MRRGAARVRRRGSPSRASSRSRRSTRARSSGGSARTARCAARWARRRPTSCTRARSPSRTSTRAGARGAGAVSRAARALAAARRSCTASAPARASSCSTSAASARSSRRLAGAGLEVVVVPGDVGRGRDPRPRAARRCSSATGPGDPALLDGPIETVRDLLGRVPLFGICLGHQLLGARARPCARSSSRSATAAPTIRCASATGRVLVTVQNHGFAVEPPTRPWSATSR